MYRGYFRNTLLPGIEVEKEMTAHREDEDVLTIPGVKHIGDEVVYEGDLRFGHAAGVPVKHWHHHRQPLSLLLVRLHDKVHDEATAAKVNAHTR